MKMKFNPDKREFGVLFINRSESRCGSCNGGALLSEEYHNTLLGWRAVDDHMEGCGEKYTAVSSDYFGMEVDISALRPDLPWVSWEEVHR